MILDYLINPIGNSKKSYRFNQANYLINSVNSKFINLNLKFKFIKNFVLVNCLSYFNFIGLAYFLIYLNYYSEFKSFKGLVN